jgi:hypothetical protein
MIKKTADIYAARAGGPPRTAALGSYQKQQRSLARLNAAGVTIALGDDTGIENTFDGYGEHRELELMVAAGMTPMQAIVTATKTSAELLKLDRLGTIATGKSADFIVLDANPLDNITNTRRISRVFLRGVETDYTRAVPLFAIAHGRFITGDDLDHSRDLLSDYVYLCRDEGIAPRPVVLTLAPCGSMKTLEFMSWLGIDVPRWLHTELTRSQDPLAESYDQCLTNARALIGFCRRLGLPFGINVESLTNRKVEIEASADLAREVRALLH